ncbi:uncharacterized membrane protein HdeD (DUF308 family) [Nitrosomonas sp. Nm84]|uniref:HdeD family acid-resistance protein n=1 Tax=Nitrosomonas sp. Nm84 TaxID=200124 RepID=UPI000D76E2E9|nr:HdeD family acid-resistance protein [Nitrosomonas sp. Nm84]PXW89848.1 uncharacterized membrane protein HdeD (DUF308 family) [Nitrosomonas sp. Nm84]
MKTTINLKPEDITELRNKWYWFLIIGVISLIGGVFSLYQPFFATLTVEILVAWIFVFSGIASILQAFQTEQKGKGWIITSGTLSIILGIVLILNPIEGIFSLTLVVASLLMVYGITQIFYAYQLRSFRGWIWLLFGGIMVVLFGAIILVQIDKLAGIALGTLLAINLIMNGTMLILASFSIKKLKESNELPADANT